MAATAHSRRPARPCRADLSFVRLPVDREGLSVIPLYAELPVVVAPKEHEIALSSTRWPSPDMAGENVPGRGGSADPDGAAGGRLRGGADDPADVRGPALQRQGHGRTGKSPARPTTQIGLAWLAAGRTRPSRSSSGSSGAGRRAARASHRCRNGRIKARAAKPPRTPKTLPRTTAEPPARGRAPTREGLRARGTNADPARRRASSPARERAGPAGDGRPRAAGRGAGDGSIRPLRAGFTAVLARLQL